MSKASLDTAIKEISDMHEADRRYDATEHLRNIKMIEIKIRRDDGTTEDIVADSKLENAIIDVLRDKALRRIGIYD
jgi:hypothetical protein